MMTQAAPGTNADFAPYLAPAHYVDSGHAAVIAFARATADAGMAPRDIAVKLYYAVRDQFRYDPYNVDLSERGLMASNVIESGRGFCISKAALLAAAARAMGVPSRLGYADVRNHLTSAKLQQMMGGDLFVFHGYTDLWIDNRWVKATPSFNLTLCQKAGIRPLEFDGRADSIFHEFDASGRRHMEYVNARGVFDDVPRTTLLGVFREHYPNMETWSQQSASADFERDVLKARVA